jgi:hypothetical protein
MKLSIVAIIILIIGLIAASCAPSGPVSTPTPPPTLEVRPEFHFDFLPVVLCLLGLAMYFVPTIIAITRHHINALAIFIVNFLTGWTAIGWIVALVWSVKRKE